jgi:hypothetical protein
MCEDHVWLQGDQLFRKCWKPFTPGGREAIVEVEIAPLQPSASFESPPECCDARLRFRIVLGDAHEHADTPHPVRLLRPRRERPSRCCTADERDELPPILTELHAIPHDERGPHRRISNWGRSACGYSSQP